MIECICEAITPDSAAVFIAAGSHAGHTCDEIRIIDGSSNGIVGFADSRTMLKWWRDFSSAYPSNQAADMLLGEKEICWCQKNASSPHVARDYALVPSLEFLRPRPSSQTSTTFPTHQNHTQYVA